MKFIAQLIAYDAPEQRIEGIIVDPKHVRGTIVEFHLSLLRKQSGFGHEFSQRRTNLFVGELKEEGSVIDVRFVALQQFRGVVHSWDPIHMRARVMYPDLGEIHSHKLGHPWLAKGDRIIFQGDPTAFDSHLEDFRFYRRVQTCQLEEGIITSLCSGIGCVETSQNEELEFSTSDVLLSDCRDLYPLELDLAHYYPDLEQSFDVGERVYFMRTQGCDPERSTIKVFVLNTDIGEADPIFRQSTTEYFGTVGEQKPASSYDYWKQSAYHEMPDFCKAQQPRIIDCRSSRLTSSCPDIYADCNY